MGEGCRIAGMTDKGRQLSAEEEVRGRGLGKTNRNGLSTLPTVTESR